MNRFKRLKIADALAAASGWTLASFFCFWVPGKCQPRSQGSLLLSLRRVGRREPWERGWESVSFCIKLWISKTCHVFDFL